MLAKRAALERQWQAGDLDVVAEVNEVLIAETLAIMLGLSPDGAADARKTPVAPTPRFAPAAMTDDDREIWSMSLNAPYLARCGHQALVTGGREPRVRSA